MEYSAEKEFAFDWMREVAEVLRPYIADAQRRTDSTRQKAAGDVVTAADHAVSELLIRRISALFPRDAICSEEGSAHDDPTRRRRWIIDPIDGTRSFIAGVPGYSVMLALAVEGTPVFAVVYDPVEDETWWAAEGQGVWRGEQRVLRHSRPPRLIWSPFAPREAGEAIARGLGIDGIVMSESFGLRAAIMAKDGGGVCASRPGGPHIWDTAAGWVIVREIGGKVTGYDVSPIEYPHAPTLHPSGFVATLGVDHNKACELMREYLPGLETGQA
ncbi:MAG: inositol monophosphatase family protein [Planctomycetes bacterium]|nr:inositol monophosphatase family protein [Planctomycetota bacterium]